MCEYFEFCLRCLPGKPRQLSIAAGRQKIMPTQIYHGCLQPVFSAEMVVDAHCHRGYSGDDNCAAGMVMDVAVSTAGVGTVIPACQ